MYTYIYIKTYVSDNIITMLYKHIIRIPSYYNIFYIKILNIILTYRYNHFNANNMSTKLPPL